VGSEKREVMLGWIGKWWRADRAYFRACGLARAGKHGEAAKAFDEVLNAFPKHVRALGRKALALAGAGRTGEAVGAARRAAELDPKNHAPLVFLGQIQYDAGNYTEARKAFSSAARLDPENRLVQAWLGLAQVAVGKVEDGAELLRAHLAYGYEGVEGRLVALAEEYLWEHREAARPLEEQLSGEEGGGDEGPAGFGLRVASLVRQMVLWPLARLRGRRAVALLMAEEAFSVRDSEGAIGRLREAEKAGADREGIALSLGQAYYEAGNAKAAVEQFARLPEEVRSRPEAALAVGGAMFDAGRYEEAREYIAIAARRYTRDFAPAYYSGLCEIALGNRKGAISWFIEMASRLNPQVARKRLEEMVRVRGEGIPRNRDTGARGGAPLRG